MHDVKIPAANPILTISANFSSYCCEELGKAADRVVEEFRAETNLDIDQDLSNFYDQNAQKENGFHEDQLKNEANGVENSTENKLKLEEKGNIDQEFEFLRNSASSPALADQIFSNGHIRPLNSVSLNNLQVTGDEVTNKSRKETPPLPLHPVRRSLKVLFLEETDSSSWEADDLDGLPPESYCKVEPKTEAAAAKEEGQQCRKGKSKRLSKRLRLKNFLNRSVFPSPDEPHHHGKKNDQKFEKLK